MKWSAVTRGKGRPEAYRLNSGERVPSVTTITGARKTGVEGLLVWANRLGQEGKDHREVRDQAAGAGSLAHAMVENAIHGLDPMESLPVENEEMLTQARQGFDAYVKWQEIAGIEYVETETPLVSEQYGYGGTPDAIGRTRQRRLALCDWKTSGAVYGDYLIQLGAYRHLWEENHEGETIHECYILRFGKEHGDFHFHSYPSAVMEMGWRAFLHLLELYRLDKQLKKVAS